MLFLYAVLFTVNAMLLGWRQAYDVNLAITSPADTTHPFPAWLLSIAGWLAAPGIAGAVAGYIINTAIVSRRGTSAERVFDKDDDA